MNRTQGAGVMGVVYFRVTSSVLCWKRPAKTRARVRHFSPRSAVKCGEIGT